MKKTIILIASLVLLLAACGSPEIPAEGKLNDFDIEPICTEELGTLKIEPGQAYDPNAEGPHVIGVFYQYEPDSSYIDLDKNAESYTGISAESLLDFTDDYRTAELITCIEITETTETDITCEYGDENEDGFILTGYDTTFDVRLIVATTGELLDSKTFVTPYTDCPLVNSFYDGDEDKDYSDVDWSEVSAFINQYIEK